MFLSKYLTNSKVFYFFIIAFTFYVYAKSVIFTGLPSIGIAFLAVLPLLMLGSKQSMYYIFYLLPFSWYFPGYIVLFLFLIIVLKNKRYNVLLQFIFALLFILQEFFHLMSYSFQIDWVHSISPMAFLSLFFYLLFYQNNNLNYSKCVKYYCIGSCLAVLLAYLTIIKLGGYDLFISGAFRSGAVEGMIFETPILNANSAAFFSLVSFSCLLFAKDKLGLPLVLYVTLLIASIVLGFMSFSRAYMLMIGFSLFLYLFIVSVRNKFIIVFVGILAFLAISFVSHSFIDSIVDVFSDRLSGANIETAGGRTIIFMSYNKWLMENTDALIWGAGINYYNEIVKIGHSTHCGLQQIVVCTGIIGLSILVIAAAKFFRMNKTSATTIQATIPFLICLAFNQSIQFFMPQFLMFPFVAAAYMYKINSNTAEFTQ